MFKRVWRCGLAVAVSVLVLAGATPALSAPSAAPSAAVSTPAAAPMAVAVLDFKAHKLPDQQDADLGRALAEHVERELARDPKLRVIPRAEVEKYIKDVALGQTGLVDAGSAVQVGKQLQARYVVAGSLTKAGLTYKLNARLVEVETGAVLVADESRFGGRRDIQQALAALLGKLGRQLAANPATQTGPRVAVIDFRPYNLHKDDEDLGRVIAEHLEVALIKAGRMRVVERAQVGDVIKEVAFSQTGLVDPSSAVRVGKQLQARYVLAGSLTRIGGQLSLDARLINVETGAVVGADIVKFVARNRMQSAVARLVERLGHWTTAMQDPPSGAPVAPVIRIAVLNFQPYKLRNAQEAEMGRAIAEQVEVAFIKSGRYQVIERAEVDKLGKEVAFSQTGLVDPASAVRLGKQLQARYVVAGSLTRVGPFFSMNARLVDVESGAVTAADDVRFAAPNRLQAALSRLIEKLSQGMK